jgi:hypothetical protein
MFLQRAFLPVLAGLLSIAAAGADAAPVAADKDAVASARIHRPATVRKLQDLHFGYLTVTGAGTAVVNPDTDLMTTTGGVTHISGLPYAALFEAVSPVRGVVIVRAPRDPITVTRVGGTETMRVSNWTVSGGGRRTVPAQEPFEFKIGGTLYVNAGQAEGVYIGTFAVEVQYP